MCNFCKWLTSSELYLTSAPGSQSQVAKVGVFKLCSGEIEVSLNPVSVASQWCK